MFLEGGDYYNMKDKIFPVEDTHDALEQYVIPGTSFQISTLKKFHFHLKRIVYGHFFWCIPTYKDNA